jgi:hypothetical protein
MAKVTKQGQVGSRMTEAEKAKANAARLAKAAKQAAKASTKTKAAKAVKSAFRKVQASKIALAVFVGIIPTDLVEPTWDNIDQFTTQVIADEQVAPVVSNPVKVKVKVSYNKPKANKALTNTRADKFAPSAPSEVIEEAIPKASSDFLKDALRKAMYNAFYEEQSLALEGYYEASRSSIAARYEQQYKDYKLSLVDAINSVTVESNTIKAKAKQDVILAYEADEAKYEKDWQQWFEDNKSSAIDEVLQEVELPIDSSLVIALIEEAKEAEEAAKVVAVKEQTAKKLAAIDAYNNKQKAEAKQSFADKHLASLAKAKKEIFFYSKVVTAQAAKAVVTNCSSVAKMNKEQAKQYLDLFLELQALVKKAKDVAGTKEFTAVLNAIYKVGSALSALYKTLSNELGYSFDDALENILGSNLQELNDVESVKSLSEKEKTNRRVIVVALDKLESK